MLRRAGIAAVLAAALLAPGAVRADFTTVNPGVTVSYTFGHGFTWGLEVSWVRWPETLDGFRQRPYGRGLAIDVSTNWRDLLKLRVGGEVAGPFIGVEAGPALVLDPGGVHVGLSVTPWAGWYVMPFYTYTYVLGRERNLHEVGTYLKLYLDPNGTGAVGSHHHDWD
ncbi:hypothetical protein [Anaeromyxobacter oryzae]|uniref:hypothetical protein n=1 Tax=Anaeromyxobacter oryzae TaxID=2918170 RepID=UPI0020BF415E|nr:hypothetical protein [Anaeromyxobacter oryzae]